MPNIERKNGASYSVGEIYQERQAPIGASLKATAEAAARQPLTNLHRTGWNDDESVSRQRRRSRPTRARSLPTKLSPRCASPRDTPLHNLRRSRIEPSVQFKSSTENLAEARSTCDRIAAVHHIAPRNSCVGEVVSLRGVRKVASAKRSPSRTTCQPQSPPATALAGDDLDMKLRETSLPADPDAAKVRARCRLHLDVARAASPTGVPVGKGTAKE